MKFKCPVYILMILFFLSFSSCKEKKSGERNSNVAKKNVSEQREQAVRVSVAELNEGVFNHELLANGKLEAVKRANLKFLTDGIIRQILIKESNRVSAGQSLAGLDDSQQGRFYAQTKLKYRQSVLDYEDQLLRLGYRMVDTHKVAKEFKNIARLRSGLSQSEIELQRAEADLRATTLKAPFSGKIANLKAKVYNNSAASEYFCTLIDDTELVVDFLVLEQELSFIRSSKHLKVIPFNDESTSYPGTIFSINPMVDKSGMISVKALIRNVDQRLLDGMSVNVKVQQSIAKQLVIPKTALVERQGRKVVFTVKNETAYWNYVEVAHENSAEYAIKSGLKPGDRIIYEGNFNLAHNKPIVIATQH